MCIRDRYDGEGPASGHVAALTDDGKRVWGSVFDRDAATQMTQHDYIDSPVRIADRTASFD